MRKYFPIFIILPLVIACSVNAFVMSSDNYRIQSDSLNVGGVRQSSASYRSEDTIGEIATDGSVSATYKLKAGYQQMQEISLSISSPVDVTMSATIPGVTGNPGAPRTGSATWQVITDNTAGFILKLKASAAPAMVLDGTYHFNDYSPAGAVPDYDWAQPAASEAEFGFTVEAETIGDEVLAFRDAGAAPCGAGALNTADKCWWNFTALDYTVINRATNTDSGGEDEVVKFQTESNAKFLKEGSYVATITATATEN